MSKLLKRELIVLLFVLLLSLILVDKFFLITLCGLAIASFIQNMAFTWVSRSRNGGDTDYHRYASWASNGVWLLTQTFIAVNVYSPITDMVNNGVNIMSIIKIGLTFLVYSIATAEGSVLMMKINLGKVNIPKFLQFLVESGNKKVGSR